MDQKKIADRVIRVIAEQLSLEIRDVKQESNLQSDLGADSLDEIEIVMAIEEEFEIEITDAEAESCKTVAEVADLVTRKGGV